MDRSVEREKPLPFDRKLVTLIKGSFFSARLMAHKEVNIGHIGINLDDTHSDILSRTGLNREIFVDALPKADSSESKPQASQDLKGFLAHASDRARFFNSTSVTIDHLLDAMTSPATSLLMEFKFSRRSREVMTIIRKQKPETREAA